MQAQHDGETGELIRRGRGDNHLQVALSRLQSDYGLSVSQARPTLLCRETIALPYQQHGRGKKQSEGHGEFVDVHPEVRPQPRGVGFQFSDRITSGVVLKQYIPAVQKEVVSYLAQGPLGFPDVDVSLVDGSHLAVDSSALAIQKAAHRVMPDCGPVLLELDHEVTISALSEFTPRVQRIVTGR